MPYKVFALHAFAGGLLWTVTFVTMGYYLGEKWKHVYSYSYRYILPIAIVAIMIYFLINFLRTDSLEYDS
jgi:membrane protein DedA with SNARE-associated domain